MRNARAGHMHRSTWAPLPGQREPLATQRAPRMILCGLGAFRAPERRDRARRAGRRHLEACRGKGAWISVWWTQRWRRARTKSWTPAGPRIGAQTPAWRPPTEAGGFTLTSATMLLMITRAERRATHLSLPHAQGLSCVTERVVDCQTCVEIRRRSNNLTSKQCRPSFE